MDRPRMLNPKTLRLDWTMDLHIWLSTGCGDQASRYKAVASICAGFTALIRPVFYTGWLYTSFSGLTHPPPRD